MNIRTIGIPPRIKRYFRENPGALFIIGFQVFLLVCGGLSIIGNSEWANGVAIAAYFLLVIGAILQFISFVRHGEKQEDDDRQA